MEWENTTTVTEFILLGLVKSWEVQAFLFSFFFLMYLTMLFSNSLILSAIMKNQHLWDSPMFFFLANLAFLDLCLPSCTTPNYLFSFMAQNQAISFHGCMAQIFCVHFFGGMEMLLLIAMAYDRYVAISHPLHYKMLMSRWHCIGLVLACWAGATLHSSLQLGFIMDAPFCGPNHVDHFFCFIPLIIKLPCTNHYPLEVMMVTNSGIMALVCFVALLVSYGLILYMILFQNSSDGNSKALSTCTSHLTVVTLYFGPIVFIYLSPFSRFGIEKVLSVFYTCVTPFLNPVIYALKNKEMKAALKKILCGHSGRICQ